jgi:hypothetical protein
MNGTIHGFPHARKDFTIDSHFQELSIDGMIIVTSIIESDPKWSLICNAYWPSYLYTAVCGFHL